ncbi:MBOAT family O-acyltransferase [Lachnoclostridium sp. Marseille-P6806]|uniref:MBOAT family O-acyltransferase n=1 Tax=Lachnoclostridium sp. Marseille-P6806 TaxID=2364793 RepID=UPI00103159CF|nr:MBOAT family O-acyltransferase [Lachnoclostridium sp. Marseille-P6806]
MVIFSGAEFAFRFFPVFLVVYYLTPRAYRDVILFLGSIFFYAAGEPRFVAVLLGLILFNWIAGQRIYARAAAGSPDRRRARRALVSAVSVNVFVLILCKALALTVSSAFLPLGMSFYIFRMISYAADLYRGKIAGRPGFLETACYFSMFPQITQGPIMRYGEGGFGGAADSEGRPLRQYSAARFEDGVISFAMGACMKLLLADRLGILWNEIAKIGYDSISTPLAWMGAYGYSFQLYYDFWGYSLMAAGIGMMLGFPYIRNFHHPYACGSVSQFYRCWHMTLGAWFRDYVYFPLGGSRGSRAETVFSLMTVWLLTGLWHGGTLNFLLWGGILGVIIVWEKLVLHSLMKKIPLIGRIHVLLLIPLTWVIFAVTDLHAMEVYFMRLFPFFGVEGNVNPGDAVKYLRSFWPLFAASIVLLFPAVSELAVRRRRSPAVFIPLAALFWWAVYYMINSSSNPFLYFSF